MKRLIRYLILFPLLVPILGFAQAARNEQVIFLWEKGAPGFESRKDEPEQAADYWVRNIHHPSITVFAPPAGKSNGCAVVVAPGGGFREIDFQREGRASAEFLNKLGITVFVLKYRLPAAEGSPYVPANVREDAHRAMRIVRSRADEFGIDPNRIGMLGFSAGGVVVMMVAFDKGDGDPEAIDPVDRVNGRPDFQMLIYPGGIAPEKIPADSPSAFILCADDDELRCNDASMAIVQTLRAAKVPVEFHLLRKGKHAFNMGDRSEYISVRNWPQRMAEWLDDSGFLNPSVQPSVSRSR